MSAIYRTNHGTVQGSSSPSSSSELDITRKFERIHDADSEALERLVDLFSPLEDLIKRVADSEDPDIRRIRAKVRAELVSLKGNLTEALAHLGHSLEPHSPEPAVRGARALHEDTWLEPALAALTVAAVALTMGRNG